MNMVTPISLRTNKSYIEARRDLQVETKVPRSLVQTLSRIIIFKLQGIK